MRSVSMVNSFFRFVFMWDECVCKMRSECISFVFWRKVFNFVIFVFKSWNICLFTRKFVIHPLSFTQRLLSLIFTFLTVLFHVLHLNSLILLSIFFLCWLISSFNNGFGLTWFSRIFLFLNLIRSIIGCVRGGSPVLFLFLGILQFQVLPRLNSLDLVLLHNLDFLRAWNLLYPVLILC